MQSHLVILIVFSALVSTVFATLLRDTRRSACASGLGLRGLRALDPRPGLADEPLPELPRPMAALAAAGRGRPRGRHRGRGDRGGGQGADRGRGCRGEGSAADPVRLGGRALPPDGRDPARRAAWSCSQEGFDAILLGALGDPRVPDNRHAADILLGLRFRLDLYVNYRPVRLFHERLCPLKGAKPEDVDFVVFRENTEGLYVMMGGHFKKDTPDEVATEIDLNTRKGVERIIRHAFEYAKAPRPDAGGHGRQVERAHPRPRAVAARLQGDGRRVPGHRGPAPLRRQPGAADDPRAAAVPGDRDLEHVRRHRDGPRGRPPGRPRHGGLRQHPSRAR